MLSSSSVETTKLPVVENISWPGSASVNQDFLFPSSVIYYMTTNPSTPKYYSKIIQQCKYFFEKNPILVARKLVGTLLCSNDSEECTTEDEDDCRVEIDINKVKSKIWLTQCLALYMNDIPNFAYIFHDKFYQYENIDLIFVDSNEIMFNDFKLIGSAFKNICITGATVISEDGNIVMLDKIVEAIPNVEKFEYLFNPEEETSAVATPSTLNNISKLKNLQKLQSFALVYVPEIFAVDDIQTFINAHKDIKIHFCFNETISEEYKNQINQLRATLSQTSNYHICHVGENCGDNFKLMIENCYGLE